VTRVTDAVSSIGYIRMTDASVNGDNTVSSIESPVSPVDDALKV